MGKKYEGTVKSLTSYGAFVDIGGVDGMVHVSELSWSRIKNPAEVVSVGDKVDVYVISFDPEKKKISLGMKDHNEDPWDEVHLHLSGGRRGQRPGRQADDLRCLRGDRARCGRPDPHLSDCRPPH